MTREREIVLLASVFVVATAGLVYELIAGALSTYLLGSSVTAFSIVIGLFLSAMGLGAWLAQYVREDLARTFVLAEIALAGVGGTSALGLFAAFATLDEGYQVALLLSCVATGALVGLEIPLLLRIVEKRVEVRVAASHVLALDYAGALLGSLAFPLILLPHLGLVRSGALLGLCNLAVALAAIRLLGEEIPRKRSLFSLGLAVGALLLMVLLGGGRATTWLEDRLYADPIVLARSTPYQRIILTRWRDDVRLYVEGHLQFSSRDEHRYHEPLVHPALASAARRGRVLILGGGDGMAAREALKHPDVRRIDLVDLDGEVTDLFAENPMLTALNGGSLSDPRVAVHNADAIRFLEDTPGPWDAIILDLPDPNDPALSRLYSEPAFRLAAQRLAPGGALVTQATSPYYAPEAFWCIVRTLEAAVGGRLQVYPYHASVPSFGDWGFALAAPGAPGPLPAVPLRFLNEDAYRSLFLLPADIQPRPVEINRLADAVLAKYYRRGWMENQAP